MKHAPTQFPEPWQAWPEPEEINDLPYEPKAFNPKPF